MVYFDLPLDATRAHSFPSIGMAMTGAPLRRVKRKTSDADTGDPEYAVITQTRCKRIIAFVIKAAEKCQGFQKACILCMVFDDVQFVYVERSNTLRVKHSDTIQFLFGSDTPVEFGLDRKMSASTYDIFVQDSNKDVLKRALCHKVFEFLLCRRLGSLCHERKHGYPEALQTCMRQNLPPPIGTLTSVDGFTISKKSGTLVATLIIPGSAPSKIIKVEFVISMSGVVFRYTKDKQTYSYDNNVESVYLGDEHDHDERYSLVLRIKGLMFLKDAAHITETMKMAYGIRTLSDVVHENTQAIAEYKTVSSKRKRLETESETLQQAATRCKEAQKNYNDAAKEREIAISEYRRVKNAVSASIDDDLLKLSEKHDKMNDAGIERGWMCSICTENPVELEFGCAHGTCKDCHAALISGRTHAQCPFCRAKIASVSVIFK